LTSAPATSTTAAVPAVDPPPPAAENPLSYPRTLESEKPPAEGLKTPEPKKADVAAKTATPPPAPVAHATPAEKTPAPAPNNPPPAPTTGSGKGWAVQVVALTDRAAANAVVQRLTGKGYPAFLVSPQPGAPVQNFKVQVGRYSDRSEAEQIKTRLKKEEQFEPWILR
jgi:cell division septation protein DedD